MRHGRANRMAYGVTHFYVDKDSFKNYVIKKLRRNSVGKQYNAREKRQRAKKQIKRKKKLLKEKLSKKG